MKEKRLSHKANDFYRWCDFCKDYFVVGKHDHELHNNAAQQSVQLTALRRGLAVLCICFIVLLALVLFTIGGN